MSEIIFKCKSVQQSAVTGPAPTVEIYKRSYFQTGLFPAALLIEEEEGQMYIEPYPTKVCLDCHDLLMTNFGKCKD